MKNKLPAIISTLFLLTACSHHEPKPMVPSTGHIAPPAATSAVSGQIPAPVTRAAVLPEPQAAESLETYTVVVNNVPVRDLLFALARDAKINIDVAGDIAGEVTMNAVDQTLPQILERLSRQLDLRYAFVDDNLVIETDKPFFKTYKVDYLSLDRTHESKVSLSTKVASTGTGGGGGSSSGGSDSSTEITNQSELKFWDTLAENIQGIIGEGQVLMNAGAGVVSVKTTSGKHAQVQSYVDLVTANARRQVLIEATIVEVLLNDEFEAGIDWASLASGAGASILGGVASAAVGAGPAAGLATSSINQFNQNNTNPFLILDFQNSDTRANGLSVSLNLLQEFGDTQVLSSPKLMTLNNQTAVLKVVDNLVYFTIEQEISPVTVAGQTPQIATTSTVNTVPVGILMQVIPQISDNDTVILNVRPSISRKIRDVPDPVNAGSLIPEITVKEMESVLRLNDGQIAVLGGLMEDRDQRDTAGVPGSSDAGEAGNLFRNRAARVRKSELVIFLRPTVVEEPSLNRDLKEFRPFLRKALQSPTAQADNGVQP